MTQEMYSPPGTPEEKLIEFVRDRINKAKNAVEGKISELGKALDPAANPGLSSDQEDPKRTLLKKR